MNKFLLIIAGLLGLVALVFFMAIYSAWAWSHVFDWYASTYLSKYASWASGVDRKTILAYFFGMGMLYAAFWGAKTIAKSSETSKKEWSEIISDLMAACFIVLVLPWLVQFFVGLYASWFGL